MTQVHERQTKTGRTRVVALDPVALEVLRRRREAQELLAGATGVTGCRGFILSREPDGSKPCLPDGLTKGFRRITERLGFPYHFHDLRHFAATHLIGAGHDPRTVANRLGHAQVSTTLNIYAKALDERDRAAAAYLGSGLVHRQIDATEESQRDD